MIVEHALNALSQFSTTRTNFWLGFAFDGMVFAILLVLGLSHPGLAPLAAVIVFVSGLFLFSFIEYFFHRWLFHQWVEVMIRGHQLHHDKPLGYDALPFFVPSLVFLAVVLIFQLVMPIQYACLLASGVVLGYIVYGLTHFILHRVRFRHLIGRKLVAYHQIHHHHPEFNFGVTSPLWDIILGTRYRSEHRRLW
jgi:sterol desaturase/sphingolipid hydroxylase (fatty acid hydroxylase superfamily)